MYLPSWPLNVDSLRTRGQSRSLILKSDYKVDNTGSHLAANYKGWFWMVAAYLFTPLASIWNESQRVDNGLSSRHATTPSHEGARALITPQTNKTTEGIKSPSRHLFSFFTIASQLHHPALCQNVVNLIGDHKGTRGDCQRISRLSCT